MRSVSQQAKGASGPAEEKPHLLALTRAELEGWLKTHGQARYRAAQIQQWVFEKHAQSFAEMTNLSKELRQRLGELCRIYAATLENIVEADDGTRKLLLRQSDGAAVECVWIPSADRHTACLSSQVGCPVGCRFCASGLDGLERNLTAGEIVEQALHVRWLMREVHGDEARLSNIVMMGMGEPLANYREVLKAIRILNAAWGLNIGARKITISTVGLPSQIRRLAREELQLNLALSLHAPDDRLRAELIPWSRGVRIAELIDACSEYFRTTGREVTIEYILLAGVNMGPHHAEKLAQIARRMRANVNLLRYNPVPGTPYVRPDAQSSYDFQQELRSRGINAHLRRSRGSSANAACGQLRRVARNAG
ncbi:MAG: 23S rRNA (adenine(2503)-C(2))-methyltransferase RlmN [Planctomycetota bacterium]|nr:MAG: 23S rRNA (adenine(2503)-C(2))-methyltransferase RlmN [Planctomycetota bacterium]